MSLALFTCVLFILLTQSLNGAKFLNITFFPTLFRTGAFPVFDIVRVPLTCIYGSI